MQTWKDIAWTLYILIALPMTFFGIWLTFRIFGVVCFAILQPRDFFAWMKEEILWPWINN